MGAFLEFGCSCGNVGFTALYIHNEEQGFKIRDLSQKYIDVKFRLQEIQ